MSCDCGSGSAVDRAWADRESRAVAVAESVPAPCVATETDRVAEMQAFVRERGRQIRGVFVWEARVLLVMWCVLAVACSGSGVLLWYMAALEPHSGGQRFALSVMVFLVSLFGYLWGSVGRSLATAYRAIKSLE